MKGIHFTTVEDSSISNPERDTFVKDVVALSIQTRYGYKIGLKSGLLPEMYHLPSSRSSRKINPNGAGALVMLNSFGKKLGFVLKNFRPILPFLCSNGKLHAQPSKVGINPV